MTAVTTDLDRLAIDTIRTLSIDGVQQANSGHPGAPMGAAPMAYVLWTRFLRHAPTNPHWPDRDRFVLSAGHASMLLYSLLHLTGYDVSLDDLKSFRQWGSRTPGHPESGLTARGRSHDWSARTGDHQRDRHGHRGASTRSGVQPRRPRDRGSLDLCHRVRWRPPGGHRVGGVQPRRASATREADRPLRRQPHPARRPDGDGVVRGRGRPLRRVRLGHPPGRRRQRSRRDRGRDRGRAIRRPSQSHRRADAHRLRQPEQAGLRRRRTAPRSAQTRSGSSRRPTAGIPTRRSSSRTRRSRSSDRRSPTASDSSLPGSRGAPRTPRHTPARRPSSTAGSPATSPMAGTRISRPTRRAPRSPPATRARTPSPRWRRVSPSCSVAPPTSPSRT